MLSNDTAAYSEDFGIAYLEGRRPRGGCAELLAALRAAPPRRGYFTRTFCEAGPLLPPGQRHAGSTAPGRPIDQLDLDRSERGLLLTSLIEAADRVDSTVGVQMAYLKRWAPRALQPLELREPDAVPGPPGTAVRRDANQLAGELDGIDVAYLDPPYNQHSYFANYHVWETLHRGDEPEHYGVACKRVDCRTTKSAVQLPAGGGRRAGRPDRADRRRRGSCSRSRTRASTTSTAVGRLLAERGRVGAVAVGVAALRRRDASASTTRRASASAPFPTCATPRCCSSAGRRGAASTRSSSQVDGTARFRFVPVPGVAGQQV